MLRMSKQADYGIVLLSYFAQKGAGVFLNARNLADESALPLPTVRKILKAFLALPVKPQGLGVHAARKGASWARNRGNALKRLRDTLELAGIPRVNERGEKIDIHALRHTFASRLARNGVGIAQAQKLLGHSDPRLTMAIYTHLGTEELRGAVESLPPLRVARG